MESAIIKVIKSEVLLKHENQSYESYSFSSDLLIPIPLVRGELNFDLTDPAQDVNHDPF